MKKDNSNLTPEEEFDTEMFEEENPKAALARIIVAGIALLATIVIILLLLFVNKKGMETPNEDQLRADIIEFSENNAIEENAIPTPKPQTFDRNQKDSAKNLKDKKANNSDNDFNSKNEKDKLNGSVSENSLKDEMAYSNEPVMELDVKNYSKVKYDAKSNLMELEDYFNQGNWEAVDDLVHLDRFIAMSYEFRGTDEFAYYGDVDSAGKPNGKGVAVYADNKYYFGDWKDGVRSGSGTWVHFHIHLKTNYTDVITYHQYVGEFRNDYPEGQGQDHYEYDPIIMQDNKWYITNYMGEFKKGLIDGDMYCTATDKNGSYCDYNGTAENGRFDYISEARDKNNRGPVLIGAENSDNYIWMSEKENRFIGVIAYNSKNK